MGGAANRKQRVYGCAGEEAGREERCERGEERRDGERREAPSGEKRSGGGGGGDARSHHMTVCCRALVVGPSRPTVQPVEVNLKGGEDAVAGERESQCGKRQREVK